MGATRPERDMGMARVECVAAAREFVAAMAGYITAPPPLESRTDQELPAWTRRDVEVVLALRDAVNHLVDARRTYDRMARRAAQPDPRR